MRKDKVLGSSEKNEDNLVDTSQKETIERMQYNQIPEINLQKDNSTNIFSSNPVAGWKRNSINRKIMNSRGYFNARKRNILTFRDFLKKSKKVQVQQEETGTQRVQVNAGYENPRISCESGYTTCSGVLINYKLTFYGTGE